LQTAYLNQVWTHDFMQDVAAGRQLRLLTIVDEFTRESLEVAGVRSMPAQAVIEVLGRLCAERGIPAYGPIDNGPEFVAAAVKDGLKGCGGRPITSIPAVPGKMPMAKALTTSSGMNV
jgi:putative transposase